MTTLCSTLNTNSATAPWRRCRDHTVVPQQGSGANLTVRFGQGTFDAEGLEATGRFFSRQITFPGGANSGVTIGRGYDMGARRATAIIRELTSAGVSEFDAIKFSRAAGLRGKAAELFVERNRDDFPILSLDAQKKLFEDVVTPDLVADIKRIFNKPDTVKAYGRPAWEDLSRGAQELVFDLRYRGDYTPTTRQRIQGLLVSRDYQALKAVMNDTAYWAGLGVPAGRIKERQTMAEQL